MDQGWPGVFRNYLLNALPVDRIASRFTERTGRPSKEAHLMLGSLILQQVHDLSEDDIQRAVAFNLEYQYALDTLDDSDASIYISKRTFRNYRRIVEEEGLAPVIFGTLTDRLLRAFGVDPSRQRLDSTHILSNMRKLGRIRIFAAAIRKFLRALKRTHGKEFTANLSPEFAGRYLAKDSDGCFSRVKPSESSRTLEALSRDLLFLIETFSAHDAITGMQEYRMLERVLREQCMVTGECARIEHSAVRPGAQSPAARSPGSIAWHFLPKIISICKQR